MWILYVQLGIELLKLMKEKEKGEELDAKDVAMLANSALGLGLIDIPTLHKIEDLPIRSILEDIAGLLGRE